jgi:hypothetical protein
MSITRTLAALAGAAVLAIGASACAVEEPADSGAKPAAHKSAAQTGPSAAEKREQRARQQGIRLTAEGAALTKEILSWATDGAKNPMGACATLKAHQRKLHRLEKITGKLERNSIAKRDNPEQLGSLRASVDSMGDTMQIVKDSCDSLGLS